MASLALCFLVTILCFINLNNVEAREGKVFFSKFNRSDNKEVVVAQPPAQANAPGQEQEQANGRLGDGPFGPGSGMNPQTKESWPVSTTTTDEEFEKLMATFDEVKGDQLPEEFEEEVQDSESEDLNDQKDKYNNNNDNGYTYNTNNNYNDNNRGYGNEEENYDTKGRNYENAPTRGYESARGNDNRRGYGNNEEERQGMSDTGFMENGKYFYDTKGRSSRNTPTRGYESARGNDHPNEFETMEEYYKSLEGTQEEFQP